MLNVFYAECHYVEFHYAECLLCCGIILNIIRLNVVAPKQCRQMLDKGVMTGTDKFTCLQCYSVNYNCKKFYSAMPGKVIFHLNQIKCINEKFIEIPATNHIGI
jgi:hypothetical protein